MSKQSISHWVAVHAIALAFSAAIGDSARGQNYGIKRIASGLNQPTYVTQAPNDPANILYYTERTKDAFPGFGAANDMGRIWRYDVRSRTRILVLDLSSRNVTNDTGLQTIAFHPDFNTPATAGFGKLYVSSSSAAATALNRVEEYNVNLSGPNPTYAATLSRTLLQYQNNTQNNHTVDWIGFDPTATGSERNYLYISTGDGSFGNGYNGGLSPTGRPSQNPNDIAGKMLRVDVVSADAYPADSLKNFAIPSTNPIPTYNAANPGSPISGLGEVYLTGLRNTYRASFDRVTGDLWMGDVGEVVAEEVSFLKAGTNVAGPPVDYGWPQREANAASGVPGAPHTTTNPFTGATSLEPVQQFLHTGGGHAVIGGYVYRGAVAALQGKYFFSDFVATGNSSQLWMLDFDRNTPTTNFNGNNGTKTDISASWQSLVFDPSDTSYGPDSTTVSSAGLDHIVSFGEDYAGNLYLVDFGNGSGFDGQYPGAGRGEIFQVVPLLAIEITVDRDTGAMQFANETGSITGIKGYSLTSLAGSIDSTQLTPVAGRLDNSPTGDGTIDPVNAWQIASPPGSHSFFSENSTGSAADFSVAESFQLSPTGGWIKSIYEDLDLMVTLGDGTLVQAFVEYIGNGGQPFERSDLNFNGDLDPADWTVFHTNHLANLSGLTKAHSYALGDLDGDGDNDFADFRLFQSDYIDANGAAAFAKLLGVPEPATWVLMLMVLALASSRFRLRSGRLRSQLPVFATFLGAGVFASSADAAVVRQYTFNNGTAQDSIGTAHGTLNGDASISFGVLDLPGNTGDYLSLPAATINIPALTDATFEAWFTVRENSGWQRVFDFGRTQTGSGRDYVFYTPTSGLGDNRAGLRNENFAENTAIGGVALSLNTVHYVAVVVDDSANGGTNQMSVYVNGVLAGDVGLSYSLSQLSNISAYVGRSLFSADPYFNGQIDEFRINNNALSATNIMDNYLAGPTPLELLSVEVNTVTGMATLKNISSTPLSFDYYRLASAAGALDLSGWNSLDDQNAGAIGPGAGQSWDEAGDSDNNELAELFLLGASTLAPNASLSLGQVYDPALFGTRQEGDLTFQFALQEEDLRQGIVSYIIPPPLPGDYNDNGIVDAADYVVWRDHLDMAVQLPNEVAGVTPGTVTTADYDAWKARFGNVLSSGGGTGAGSAVPEPPSAMLFLLAAMWHTRRSPANRPWPPGRPGSRVRQLDVGASTGASRFPT